MIYHELNFFVAKYPQYYKIKSRTKPKFKKAEPTVHKLIHIQKI